MIHQCVTDRIFSTKKMVPWSIHIRAIGHAAKCLGPLVMQLQYLFYKQLTFVFKTTIWKANYSRSHKTMFPKVIIYIWGLFETVNDVSKLLDELSKMPSQMEVALWPCRNSWMFECFSQFNMHLKRNRYGLLWWRFAFHKC